MQELNGFTGVVYAASIWVMRLSAVNILWFILSLPLFAVFLVINMDSPAGVVLFGIAVLLFMPLLFFPATAAVFASARDWVLEIDPSSVMRAYITHLKRDYKDSAKAGAVFTAVWLAWYYGSFFFQSENSSASLLFMILGAALFIYTVIFLAISVHFRMSIKERLKNALFVSVGRPFLSLFVLVSCGLLLWISVAQLFMLLPLFTCSLSAFMAFSAFYRFTLKVGKQKAADKPG